MSDKKIEERVEVSGPLANCKLFGLMVLVELADDEFRKTCRCSKRFNVLCNGSDATPRLYRERVQRWFPSQIGLYDQIALKISWKRFYNALHRIEKNYDPNNSSKQEMEQFLGRLGRLGLLSELKILKFQDDTLDLMEALEQAALNGRLPVIEWIVETEGPELIDGKVAKALLERNDVEIDRWLNRNISEDNAQEVAGAAASLGRLDILKYILEGFTDLGDDEALIANEAAYSGDVPTLEWLTTYRILPHYEELMWMYDELGRPRAMADFIEAYF